MKPYGLIGAGSVSRSVIAKLPNRTSELGPVVSMSYRVASRLTNSLGAGTPARTVAELDAAEVILFFSNPVGTGRLVEMLVSPKLPWKRRVILVCDTDITANETKALRSRGSVLATVQQIGIPGMFVVWGDAEATKAAKAFVARLQGRALILPEEKTPLFRAGLTIGSALLTPMLERTAECFRLAGMRDSNAIELAAAVFEKTSRNFGHSGKQSWVWHSRKPDVDKLNGEIVALEQATTFSEDFRRDILTALNAIKSEDDRIEKTVSRLQRYLKTFNEASLT